MSDGAIGFGAIHKILLATDLKVGYTIPELKSAFGRFLANLDRTNEKAMWYANKNFCETASQLVDTLRSEKAKRVVEESAYKATAERIQADAERERVQLAAARAKEQEQYLNVGIAVYLIPYDAALPLQFLNPTVHQRVSVVVIEIEKAGEGF
jgi:hypothetical protein